MSDLVGHLQASLDQVPDAWGDLYSSHQTFLEVVSLGPGPLEELVFITSSNLPLEGRHLSEVLEASGKIGKNGKNSNIYCINILNLFHINMVLFQG